MTTGMPDGGQLLMPFVCVQSQGGPFDDLSFCAGVQMAHCFIALSMQPPEHRATVYTPLLAQLDLVAMLHGYTLRHQQHGDPPSPIWSAVCFTRAPSIQGAETP